MKSRRASSKKRAFYRRRGVWVTIIMLLLAGSGAAWYFLRGPGAAQSAALEGPQVLTATVKRGTVSVSASGSGTLVASQTVDLSFSTSGTVAELNVKVGDTVQAGETLARLDNTLSLEADLASAQLQLLQARQDLQDLQQGADLNLAQAYHDLLTAQETYADKEAASQRTAYARCSKEVRLRYDQTLEQAQEKLDELTKNDYGSFAWINAKNDLDTAQANATYCAGYTDAEKTDAQAELDIAAAELRQAEQTYNKLREDSGIDPDALALAEATVDEAEKQEASVQEDLTGIILTAPISGKVTYLAAEKGTIVGTDKFITIADVSQPTLDVSVDETDLDKLVVGTAAKVIFDALPDQTFNGTVTQVDPQLTASGPYRVATGQVTLDADSPVTVQSLPLSVSASVTIISQEASDVLVVPVAALKEMGGQGYTVMVVAKDGTVSTQKVQVGLQDSQNAEITSGLSEGQMVSIGVAQTGSSSSTDNQFQGGMMFPDGRQPPDDGGVPMP